MALTLIKFAALIGCRNWANFYLRQGFYFRVYGQIHVSSLVMTCLGNVSVGCPDLIFQSPIFICWSPHVFNIFTYSAWVMASRIWVTFNGFLAIIETFIPQFYLAFTYWIIPQILLNHLNALMNVSVLS